MTKALRESMRRHPAGRLMRHTGATVLPLRPVHSTSTATADTTAQEGTMMTETTAPAKSKPGRKSNDEKSALPALDLDALVVEDAEVPAITRQREERPNPFLDSLSATYDARKAGNEKAGKAVTIPTERANEVKYLIRQAAKRLNIGARIAESDNGDGTTRIVFAGKDKRASKATENGAAESATA